MASKNGQNSKTKTKTKTKKKEADSDTKTLVMIVGGLGAMLLLVGGMIGAYSYFNTPEKTKVVKELSPVKASGGGTAQSAQDQAQANALANTPSVDKLAAFEGPRSTFNPTTAFEPGEVVLADPPQGFEDKIRPLGFRVTEHVRLAKLGLSLVRVATPAKMSVKDAIRVLARELPGITIDANSHFDPSAGIGIDRASANPRAIAGWQDLSPTCGKGLVLGQIDSGVDITHPALKGSDVTYRSFTKSGRQAGPPDHGTSVAAMLVGNAEWGGLMPGAKLYAANMFEINEQGKKVGSAVGLLQAVDWLVSQNVNAVNLSIAGGDNKVVRKAFGMARRQNMILVAAVGNWGRADKPAYPAPYEHGGAGTATKGAELVYSHANTGKYVDFSAPGVGIYTALPGGGGKPQSGTSFATPYLTVMAAILAHAGKTPDAATLRKLLSRATRDLGRPGKDEVFGFGSVKAKPVCQS